MTNLNNMAVNVVCELQNDSTAICGDSPQKPGFKLLVAKIKLLESTKRRFSKSVSQLTLNIAFPNSKATSQG